MVASLPVPKRKEDFINGHVTKKRDQKWVREYPSEAAIGQLNEADRSALQDRELDRRVNGCWFLNNGDPVFLTGDNYFYLTHFKLPAGYYPDFRMADVQFYWWWKFAVEDDPNCIGGIFLGARQRGKTARAAAATSGATLSQVAGFSRARRTASGQGIASRAPFWIVVCVPLIALPP
ncbi:MAG: hypothetical protein NVSMB30_10050 [Hymenobacter sp.]